MNRNLRKGFSSIEFIGVLTVIVVILAFSIPKIVSTKIAANETAAISDLYKLGSAFEAYRSIYSTYPRDFSDLNNLAPDLIGQEFVSVSGAEYAKGGYAFKIDSVDTDIVPTYAFRIYAEPKVSSFRVTAGLVSGIPTGRRVFKYGVNKADASVGYYAKNPGTSQPEAISDWIPLTGVEGRGFMGTSTTTPPPPPPPPTSPPTTTTTTTTTTTSDTALTFTTQTITTTIATITTTTTTTSTTTTTLGLIGTTTTVQTTTTTDVTETLPGLLSCPYVHVWDGSQFIKDNDIIPGGNTHEYTDYYKLTKQVSADKNGDLLFKIIEPLDEKSYLDKAHLIEVRHPKFVNIAPSPEGEMFTYKQRALRRPRKAIDTNGEDILSLVSSKGKGDYHGLPGDFVTFDFGKIKKAPNGMRLILSSDLEYAYAAKSTKSLHIEVFLEDSYWQEISIVHPHEAWDIWAIDLASFKDKIAGELRVKINWKNEHKLDFALLDMSAQVPIKIRDLALVEAKHNKRFFSNVMSLLKKSDNRYAKMVKGDEISLRFRGSSKGLEPKEVLSYIFVSEGFYKPLIKK
ncbi:MAG: hypothetical protein KJ593_04080 [Candidatus Omnitrophica bacterium]|nr:hypothetical protein [Candidatus Omnitrophota bacterium]